jgi:hypothetical protein
VRPGIKLRRTFFWLGREALTVGLTNEDNGESDKMWTDRLFLERRDLADPRGKYLLRIASKPSFRVGDALLQKIVRKNLRFAMVSA